jgi:hypothetical protein
MSSVYHKNRLVESAPLAMRLASGLITPTWSSHMHSYSKNPIYLFSILQRKPALKAFIVTSTNLQWWRRTCSCGSRRSHLPHLVPQMFAKDGRYDIARMMEDWIQLIIVHWPAIGSSAIRRPLFARDDIPFKR